MSHSIRQYIETLEEPSGLTRTLGEIEVCRTTAGDPIRMAGNSAVVFKILHQGRPKMLKCYTRSMPHLDKIYGEKFLRGELYVWEADGRSEWCDVVVDDWIDGVTLLQAIFRATQAGDQAQLRLLAREFDRLALDLLHSDWAHGDLKPENILVTESGKLQLVDFDAVFLPVFAGEKSPELGTAAYQHPARTADDFDASVDDYSIALIHTSLYALSLDPTLLLRHDEPEGILLSPRQIARHRSTAYTECLGLFEQAGAAVHYRIAQLLKSPLLRLPELPSLVEYSVCKVGTSAEKSELFVRDGAWGFRQGDQELIPPIYTAGFDFTEGLAAVRTGRRWHFIDEQGTVVIPCTDYDAVKPFAGGRAIVIRDNQRFAINRQGEETLLDF